MSDLAQLPCPYCQKLWGIEALLDACVRSWPLKQLLLFECPQCEMVSHLELNAPQLSSGMLDGWPGPSFFATATMNVPDLLATQHEEGADIQWAGRVWKVKRQSS